MENVVLTQIPVDSLQEMIRQAIHEEMKSSSSIVKPSEAKKPLTMVELADYLGVTVQTIIRKMKKGEIPYFRIGDSPRYELEKVLKALSKK